MSIGPYVKLKRVEQLVRIPDHIDSVESDQIVPPGWGPASFWRLAFFVLGVLIAGLTLFQLLAWGVAI